MNLRKYVPAVFLAVAMAGTAWGAAQTAQQEEQSPKQDMKDAGPPRRQLREAGMR
jgi:hypothetical protein